MQPLQAQRYFLRWCFRMAKRRSTTVTSSLSSVWPFISRRSPPHCGQVRSASSSSWMMSRMGRDGCTRGPCPRRGTFSEAGVPSPGRTRFSVFSPKITWSRCASSSFRASSSRCSVVAVRFLRRSISAARAWMRSCRWRFSRSSNTATFLSVSVSVIRSMCIASAVDHGAITGSRVFSRPREKIGGLKTTRPTSVLPSRNNCSSPSVRRSVFVPSSRHRHANRPRSRRLA